jgi:hypothetical protein
LTRKRAIRKRYLLGVSDPALDVEGRKAFARAVEAAFPSPKRVIVWLGAFFIVKSTWKELPDLRDWAGGRTVRASLLTTLRTSGSIGKLKKEAKEPELARDDEVLL